MRDAAADEELDVVGRGSLVPATKALRACAEDMRLLRA